VRKQLLRPNGNPRSSAVSSVSGVFVSRLRIWQKKMPNAICQLFLEKTLPRMGSVAGLCGSVQRVALP
jgi:hypothetical protein